MKQNGMRLKAEIGSLSALEPDHQVSQSRLAKRLDIAVGLVNILIKPAGKRGVVKMSKVPARRYAHYLAPKGFSEKAWLISRYPDDSLLFYPRLRVEYRDMFSTLTANGISEVTLVGGVDIPELAIKASFDHFIDITALVCAKTNKENNWTIPDISNVHNNQNRVIVICDAHTP